MKKLNLNENFISKIWENPEFYHNLTTNKGEIVEIIEYGRRNFDSGADYSNAKARIGNILYSGDIEIHRSEKDWHLHKHKKDGKYSKVILNIVMWESDGDRAAKARKSREIPTVILSKFLSKSIHEIWKDIINNPSESFKLPCYQKNKEVPEDEKMDFINKTGIKRLKYRALRIEQMQYEPDIDFKNKLYWETALFTYIAEALGFSKNKKQFLKFSSIIKLNLIKSRSLSLIQIDSLFFGTAGFLKEERHTDEYTKTLKNEWGKLKYDITKDVMDKSEWNFFRLRPPNFPTLRLAYLSGITFEILYNDFLKKIILCFENSKRPSAEIKKLFLGINISDYWKSHYNFGKTKKQTGNIIGSTRINDIITNVILPLSALYARKFDKKDLMTKITDYYLNTKDSSENEVTRVMQNQIEIKLKTISEKQGAIHLHNLYCVEGKCKECYIGNRVFEDPQVRECLRIILY